MQKVLVYTAVRHGHVTTLIVAKAGYGIIECKFHVLL